MQKQEKYKSFSFCVLKSRRVDDQVPFFNHFTVRRKQEEGEEEEKGQKLFEFAVFS